MAKIVINTQFRENYGAHDWDGEGQCPQYWKYKGGSTYVIENLTQAQADKAIASGFPNLRGLIEYANDYAEEYIIGTDSVEDDAKVCEEWETPIRLAYLEGQWKACEIQINDEYGYMNQKIERVIRVWTLGPKGKQDDAKCNYVLRDGRVVPSSKINEVLSI